MIAKRLVDELFMHYFQNIRQLDSIGTPSMDLDAAGGRKPQTS